MMRTFIATTLLLISAVVASSTQFSIRSEALDETRAIYVRVPDSYDWETSRTTRYPVVYLLDGMAYFDATIGVAHHLGSPNAAVQRIPDLIIVVVANTKRSRDMTPSAVTAGLYASGSGGASSFRKFLEAELIAASRLFFDQANTPDTAPGENDAHEAGFVAFGKMLKKSGIREAATYKYFHDETHLSIPLRAIYSGLLSTGSSPGS